MRHKAIYEEIMPVDNCDVDLILGWEINKYYIITELHISVNFL